MSGTLATRRLRAHLTMDDGHEHGVGRRKLNASYSKTTAREWGERRERELLLSGPRIRKEVPTLEAFAPRFIEGYARANRQKPSGIAAKEGILRIHPIPELGARRSTRSATSRCSN